MVEDLKKLGVKVNETDTETEIIFEKESFILLSNDTFFVKGYEEPNSYSIPFCVLRKTIFKYDFVKSKKVLEIRFKYEGTSYYFHFKLNKDLVSKELSNCNSSILYLNKLFSKFDKYIKERISFHSKKIVKNEKMINF